MRLDKTDNGKTLFASFDSMGDFMNWIETDRRKGAYSETTETRKFNGFMSLDDAIKAGVYGWNEGTKDIDKLFSKLSGGIEKPENNIYSYDVSGDIYDIGRIAEGVPECALIPDSTAANKIYKFAFNISKSGGVDADQIKNLGAAVSALVQTIQTGGDSVQLDLFEPVTEIRGKGQPKNKSKNVIFKISVDCSLLDIDQLMFATGCPAMLRRLIFAGDEILLDVDDCDGYGYPEGLKSEKLKKIIDLSEYDLIIDSKIAGHGMPEFATIDSSINWINKQLDSLTRGENENAA